MAEGRTDIAALVRLAAGDPGATRDWARARLALWAPERFRALPDAAWQAEVCFAARPPGLIAAAIQALGATRPCTLHLASTLASFAVYGSLPDGEEELLDAIRGSLQGNGAAADPWLAWILAAHDALRPHELQAAQAGAGDDHGWLLPAIRLRTAERCGGLDDAVEAVAPALAHDPDSLRTTLRLLGVPPLAVPGVGIRDAAQHGALEAGGFLSRIPARHDDRDARARGWLAELLDGTPGAAATLLRRVHGDRTPPLDVIAAAGWLATYRPSDPVRDVLSRGCCASPRTLASARGASAGRGEEVARALSSRWDHGPALLALDHLPTLAEPVVRRFLALRRPSPAWHGAAAVAAARAPGSVAEALRREDHRDAALALAPWAPAPYVADDLLALPIPSSSSARLHYAHALAASADRRALAPFAALLEAHPGEIPRPTIALAQGLLL